MLNTKLIKSVIKEYGAGWAINRSAYSAKLKLLGTVSGAERCFEKKPPYPKRLDLFQIDVPGLKDFINNLPDEDKTELIKTADKACDGIIRGFSSVELDYGNPIDWQLSPLTGRRCNETKKWYSIPDFDQERGDIKVVWEASRFSHFIILSRAFLLTGNEKYYQAFSTQLREWLEKNPYGFGANFKCGQECSLRMVNALLAYTVFAECGAATDADAGSVKDLVDRCYRKILSNFFYAYKCIRNNHTISELMGIIVGAWCCDDQKQLDKAFTLLDEVIDEQFTEDGGYCQFSFNYQRLALQDLECVLSIEEHIGKRLSNRSKEKIKQAAFLMYQCQDESGDMPNYGSNDGALVFPVTAYAYRNFSPVINTAYALVTGQQLYEDGAHREEMLWFSGGKLLSEYPTAKVERSSSRFPEAGLFTLRNKQAWAMVVLNDYHSRPAHLDQLHLDVWIDGINVLCDAGTFSYADDLGKVLRMNESHNTATLTGRPQMSAYKPFMICNWTKRRLAASKEGTFEGTMISDNGYTHTRRIEQTEWGFRITDLVCARDGDSIALRFHTPLNVSCDGNTAWLCRDGKTVCEIKAEQPITVMEAQRSMYYLRAEPDTCLNIDIQNHQRVITDLVLIQRR